MTRQHLLDAVLTGERRAVADQRGVQQHLVGRRALPALLGELHVEGDLLGPAARRRVRVDDQPDAGDRVELDHELALDRRAVPDRREEAEPRRTAEHQPQLGLGDRQALARCG